MASIIYTAKIKWSIIFVMAWFLVALFTPFLANEKGGLIPYSPTTIDFNNANSVGPFDHQNIERITDRHWLGTDELGRDVLTNLIYGGRTACLVGIGAMLIAAFIGVLLGVLSAYFGDDGLQLSWLELFVLAALKVGLILLLVSFPWAFASGLMWVELGAVVLIYCFLFWLVHKALQYLSDKFSWRKITYPVDLIIGRMIEIMDALPVLFILIVLAALVEPSILSTTLIIGLVSWASIARFSRAELLKIKQLDYIESTKALGLKGRMIVLKHMLPNGLPPVLITLAFGVSASILMESTLSFLGLGISTETASWGKLLSEARANYKAWWLALFPGLAIFATVLSCNLIGEQLSKRR